MNQEFWDKMYHSSCLQLWSNGNL